MKVCKKQIFIRLDGLIKLSCFGLAYLRLRLRPFWLQRTRFHRPAASSSLKAAPELPLGDPSRLFEEHKAGIIMPPTLLA